MDAEGLHPTSWGLSIVCVEASSAYVTISIRTYSRAHQYHTVTPQGEGLIRIAILIDRNLAKSIFHRGTPPA
jgi:hypothetical protein